jgi:hypothetical protein
MLYTRLQDSIEELAPPMPGRAAPQKSKHGYFTIVILDKLCAVDCMLVHFA